MINKYISKPYINNSSDILSFLNDNNFQNILSKLNKNKIIKVSSKLIHKQEYINQLEQFIFNLDNYISYIKQSIHINPLELRYIINLTLYNKYNKCLYMDLYYYDNVDIYIKNFKKMFMHNYLKNIKLISKYTSVKKRNFNELVEIINTNKKRTYCYFENINNNNMNFYLSIIESLEQIN